MVACGYSSRIVAASCQPAGRVGGLTRQARQIVTHQRNLITTPQVDGCGMAGLGVAVYWESGAEWSGGGWGGVVGGSRTECGVWRGGQRWG